jgi:hypothetical protein
MKTYEVIYRCSSTGNIIIEKAEAEDLYSLVSILNDSDIFDWQVLQIINIGAFYE